MKNVILSTCFGQNNFGYISGWYESMLHHHLSGIVFYDSLDSDLVSASANDYIRFQKVTPAHQYNDSRWTIYREFLEHHGHEYDYIFSTDVSDVIIGRSPFADIEKYGNVLFTGDENNPEFLKAGGGVYGHWFIRDNNRLLKDLVPEVYSHIHDNPDYMIFNCGVVGANRDLFIDYINRMAALMDRAGKLSCTIDMSLHNYLLRTYYSFQVVHGYPVNSQFFAWQKERNDVWFIHK